MMGAKANAISLLFFLAIFLGFADQVCPTTPNSGGSSTHSQRQNHQEETAQPALASDPLLVEENVGEGQLVEAEHKDLFQEFLSRGMFSCATKYVGILQKLNKLIVTARQEYKQCQSPIERSVEESAKLAAQLDFINEKLRTE